MIGPNTVAYLNVDSAVAGTLAIMLDCNLHSCPQLLPRINATLCRSKSSVVQTSVHCCKAGMLQHVGALC